MAIEETKLYLLYRIRDSGSSQQIVAGSHSMKKLESLGHTETWYIVNDPNNEWLRRKSGDTYPKFLIYEEPYVS